MRELVEYILKQIVGDEGYEVMLIEDESEVKIKVIADKLLIGKIIGKSGRIAKSIRTLVKAATAKSDKKTTVSIEERVD